MRSLLGRTIADPEASPGEVDWAISAAGREELIAAQRLLDAAVDELERRQVRLAARRAELLALHGRSILTG